MNRYLDHIKKLLAKSVAINGIRLDPNGADLLGSVNAFLTEASKGVSAEDKERAIDLIRRAHLNGDPEAALALNEVRIEQLNNYLFPSIELAKRFFNVVVLAPADRPLVQVRTKMQVSIDYVGEDGEPRSRKILPDFTEELIPLHLLWSDDVEYKPLDIYNGDIAQVALDTVNLAFDLAIKVDSLAMTLLTRQYSAFVTSGKKSARTYVPHSEIKTENFPATNDIVLSDNTTSTVFRIAVLQAIVQYCDSWGMAWPEGKLAPTGEVFVPSSETTDILKSFPPNTVITNRVVEQVLSDYTGFEYANYKWRFIPENRLPKRMCLPVLNKPVGKSSGVASKYLTIAASLPQPSAASRRRRGTGRRRCPNSPHGTIPRHHHAPWSGPGPLHTPEKRICQLFRCDPIAFLCAERRGPRSPALSRH